MTTLEQQFERFRRTGDPDALATVYDETAPRLLRTALHLCGSPAEAEDALQAAFVAAIEQRQRWDPTRPLLPWLVGIVANQAKTARARARRVPDPARAAQPAAADPLQQVSELEFTAAIDAAIDRLPEIYQSVLVLHLRHGLAPADIAHALRRPPGTVRAQLARGLEKLRALLPAGIASMVVVAIGERGLAAVRDAVLTHARALPLAGTAVGAATLTGVLLMKKLALVGAAVAAAALFVWSPWSSAADGPVPLPPGDQMPAAAVARGPSGTGGGSGGGGGAAAAPADAPSRTRVKAGGGEPTASPLASDDAEPGVVRGRAVWASDGSPAADLLVWCRDTAAPTTFLRRETRTDADGRFRFERDPERACTVGAGCGGELHVGTRQRGEVLLQIPAGVTVRGVVVDGDGSPVRGAGLWVSDRDNRDVGTVVAHADDGGHFALRDLGTRRYLGARAAGFAPSAIELVDGALGAELQLELRMQRGDATVRGTVVDVDGAPVPQALVRIAPLDEPQIVRRASGAIAFGWTSALARVDGEGAFELRGLRPGGLRVQVRAPGSGTFATDVQVPAGGAAAVRAVLPPAGRVSGRVVRTGEEPVAGLVVRVGEWNTFDHVRGTVRFDGGYELDGVTPGRVQVELLDQNRTLLRRELVVSPGATIEWNPAIGEVPGVRGAVVDGSHRPLAGWRVMAFRDGAFVAVADTDVDGTFALPSLGAARCELRVVSHPTGTGVDRLAQQTALQLDVQPGGLPLTLVVDDAHQPQCALRGRVVGQDGHGRAARVQCGHMDGGGVVTAAPGDDGVFALQALVPGPYWITVHAEGMPEVVVGRRELRNGVPQDLGDLALAAGVEVQGRVQLPPAAAGAVGPRAFRVAVLEQERGLVADLEASGDAFRTPPLAAGDYRLVVHGPGLAPTAASLRIGAAPVPVLDFLVGPGRRRPLRAGLPASAPTPQWVAGSLLQDGRLILGVTLAPQSDGSWAGDLWLGGGDYALVVGTDGGGYDATVELHEADAGPVELRLQRR